MEKKMTKTKSIRKFCLACVGDSPKDVAFCTDPKCALWEHRLGTDLRSTKGVEIMTKYCQKYPKDFAELKDYGIDPALYRPRTPRRIRPKPLNKGLQAFNSRQKELVGMDM
jgi:hypothetical protein